MKILKNKTYHELLDQISFLQEENDHLSLDRANYDLEITLLKKEIGRLNTEKAYLNLTRDSKGVLHSIVKKEKVKPTAILSAKEFAEKHLGKKAKTEIGIGKICGYDDGRVCVLVGYNNNDRGHGGDSDGVVKLEEYPSYYWQHKDLVELIK